MRLVLLAALVMAAPAAAQAPHAAILSLGGDAPEDEAARARTLLAAALEADGVRVMPEANVAVRIAPARLRSCSDIACAHAIGTELSVAMVATITLWQGASASVSVSLVLSEHDSFTGTREIGDAGMEAAIEAALEAAQDQRRRAVVQTTESNPYLHAEVPEPPPPATGPTPLAERPIEQWILPIALGGIGVALGVVAIYALLDETCSLRGASGTCLRGERPNIGLGITFAIVGGLSIAGGLAWLIVGGTPPTTNAGRIDVVLGPGGVGVGF